MAQREAQKKDEEPELTGSNYILDTPLHDTGNVWYTVGSLLLPPLGLIGGWIFKKFNHIRNYKACKKGAIAGLITKFAIVGLFALALLSALL
jgi:oligopeptide transport system ATP-binding protein